MGIYPQAHILFQAHVLLKNTIDIAMPLGLWWLRDVIARVFLDLLKLARLQVDFVRLQILGLLDEFPAEIEHWEEEDHHIGEEESCDIPLTLRVVN